MSNLIVKNANDELKQAIRALLEGHKSVEVVEEEDVIDLDDFKITKTLQREIDKFWNKEVKLKSTLFGGAPVEIVLSMFDEWYVGSENDIFYISDIIFTNCPVSKRKGVADRILDAWSGDTVLELAKVDKGFTKEYDKLVKAATEEYTRLQRKIIDAVKKQFSSVNNSEINEIAELVSRQYI